MGPRQAVHLGESILPWTSKPSSLLCWRCTLQQHLRLIHRGSATRDAHPQAVKRRYGTYTSSFSGPKRREHSQASQPPNLESPVTTVAEAAGSGRGSPVVISRTTTRHRRNLPLLAEQNVSLDGVERDKQLEDRRGLGMIPASSLEAQQPKPSLVTLVPANYDVPQGKLRTLSVGKRLISTRLESEEKLDAALDYWIAQKGRAANHPLRAPPASTATDITQASYSGSGLRRISHDIGSFLEGKQASMGRRRIHLRSTKAMSVNSQRAIHTTNSRFLAAAHSQEAISLEKIPADPIPPYGVGTTMPIREHLRLWETQHKEQETETVSNFFDRAKPGALQNILTRPSDGDVLVDPLDREDDIGLWPETNFGPDGVAEVDLDTPFLRCGDLVELVPTVANREAVLAIFIRHFSNQAQFYTMQGKWLHRVPRSIFFSVQRFVSRELVAEIMPYLPGREVDDELADKLHAFDVSVPRETGSAIVNEIRTFADAAEAAYRHYSSRLDNAHDLVAHETDVLYLTLQELASKILQPRAHGTSSLPWSQPTLYALHRALLQNEFGFGIDQTSHRSTDRFEIRSKQELRAVNEVRTWLREYQENLVTSATTGGHQTILRDAGKINPIADFVRKVRKLIIHSRTTRAPSKTGTIGPSSVRLDITKGEPPYTARATTRYSETDKTIIRFFELWAGYRKISRHVPLNSLASMILRVVGMYEEYELDQSTAWLFLQEIGVYTPWENRLVLNTALGLPGHNITPEADELRLENTRVGKSTGHMEDTMQAHRKDWGDLEVFCIDNEDAKEIDDGISLEEIQGSESTYWVHVHTANPSAFISKDGTLAKYAAHLIETIYLPERIYPMLPRTVTRSRLSLAPDRPTLTFSAKLNMDGEVLEVKVTPGIIRKVTFATPETIRQVLSEGTPSRPETIITVGGEMPDRKRESLRQSFTESQRQILRRLLDLGAAHRKLREQKGGTYVRLPYPDTLVYLGHFGEIPRSLTARPRAITYDGDPVIQIRSGHFDPIRDPTLTTVDDLVPDLMIIACEAAALWCKARNIPVLYRSTVHNPDLDPETFRKEVVQPTIEKVGYLPLVVGLRYAKVVGKSAVSTTPNAHRIIGVDQYAKCTSPLRRYGDLLLHWQVEAAIRHEAKTGKSLVGSTDNSYLAFSQDQLDAMVPRVDYRERMINGVKRNSVRHWAVLLLSRAFYFKEATLPETWELFIFSQGAVKYSGKYSGIFKLTGIDAELESTPLSREIGVKLGDWWEVKIASVDTYKRAVTVEGVRLISRASSVVSEQQKAALDFRPDI